jgi:GNAT superfamily N-acetyltransferase
MLAEADEGQGAFLPRLRDEWLSGAMRFDKEGEILLGAWVEGALVGVGGISQDPYASAPDLGRVRHVYVLRAHRGRGIASRLVAALVDHARARFAILRLRTRNPAAARLYERLGFTAYSAPEETHRLLL